MVHLSSSEEHAWVLKELWLEHSKQVRKRQLMRILSTTEFLGGDGMNHMRSERGVKGGCILDIHIYLDILDIFLKSTKSVDELDTTGLGERGKFRRTPGSAVNSIITCMRKIQ